jgi:hypothetical protein
LIPKTVGEIQVNSKGGTMNQETTPEASKPKKKYIRRRRTDLALEVALRDAAAATESGADPATKGLIQTRLNILNQQLTRERNDRLKRALAEAERLSAENEKLKGQLAQALAGQPTSPVTVEIEQALAKYRKTAVDARTF